jgi:methyl-accepting chemotaxis protein
MRGWTIGKRIIVGFSAVIAMAAILGAIAFSRLMAIETQATRIVVDSLPGVYISSQIDAESRTRFGLTLQHIIASDQQEMARIEAAIQQADAHVDELLVAYEGTITTAQDRQNFDQLKPVEARIRQVRDGQIMPLSRAMKTAEAEALVKSALEPARQAHMQAIRTLVDFNKTSGDDASQLIQAAVSMAKTGVLITLALALIISLAVATVIVRGTSAVLSAVVGDLTAGATQVASAAGQVATSAQSLSTGATTQAAALEETSASMEEMASMTRQNAENSREGATLMGAVDQRVRDSNRALTAMVGSMQSIHESSNKVSKIIKTIDEIAFQTNILALNAAVEAARAGESGMGFAVVADEVRALAQRSAQAARDTSALIEESIGNAHDGVQRVEEVSSAFAAIAGSVGTARKLVDEVSAASQQQTQGIDQVSKAIAQLEQLTQQTAANSEESAAASEELNAQAEMTMTIVTRLQALVRGGGRRAESVDLADTFDSAPPASRSTRQAA